MKTPYHHELLLRRWAQRHNFDIGVEGWSGYSLFVAASKLNGPEAEFVVEGRGNVVHRMREQYKFYDRQSRIMPFSRDRAFRQALDLYVRLTAPVGTSITEWVYKNSRFKAAAVWRGPPVHLGYGHERLWIPGSDVKIRIPYRETR